MASRSASGSASYCSGVSVWPSLTGRQHEPGLPARQGEAALLHDRIQRPETLGAQLVQLAAERVAVLHVLIAHEDLVQRLRDLRQERVDLVPQQVAAAGRQAERDRPVRLREVMRVAPIRRHRSGRGLILQVAGDDARLACAGGPGGEDVEPGVGDLQPKLDRAGCPVLADDAFQVGRVRGRGKIKTGGIESPAQLSGSELNRWGHAGLLSSIFNPQHCTTGPRAREAVLLADISTPVLPGGAGTVIVS